MSFDKALAGVPGAKRVLRDGRRQVVADVGLEGKERLRVGTVVEKVLSGGERKMLAIGLGKHDGADRMHRQGYGVFDRLDIVLALATGQYMS